MAVLHPGGISPPASAGLDSERGGPGLWDPMNCGSIPGTDDEALSLEQGSMSTVCSLDQALSVTFLGPRGCPAEWVSEETGTEMASDLLRVTQTETPEPASKPRSVRFWAMTIID